MLACVFLLMVVAMYMALAGPYSLFKLKQAETTEIKTVIVIARHGDELPSSEAYFFGEQLKRRSSTDSSIDPNSDEETMGRLVRDPANQLTNIGKERMYLLGKFLKLRYYDRLLNGESQRLFVRSSDADKSLESAQLLVAGLNPPKSGSIWSPEPEHELAARWQPKAIHTTDESSDDLLSSRSKCLLNYEFSNQRSRSWKNSSKYLHLLNEFRHDLQVLRLNTGLDFEDDLEMLIDIEENLRARAASGNSPSWYTTTMAQRLTHIADVTSGCKFGQPEAQRLYAGRLLHSITEDILSRLDSGARGARVNVSRDQSESTSTNRERKRDKGISFLGRSSNRDALGEEDISINHKSMDHSSSVSRMKDARMSLYITDKLHLTALLHALKIYSTQPHYGFLLIIELHYDPSNRVHFLRLFTVNSLIYNVFPEPVRVNPTACPRDSVECSPEQFRQNIEHLAVDKKTWSNQLCSDSRQETTATTTPAIITTTAAATTTSSYEEARSNLQSTKPPQMSINEIAPVTESTIGPSSESSPDNQLTTVSTTIPSSPQSEPTTTSSVTEIGSTEVPSSSTSNSTLTTNSTEVQTNNDQSPASTTESLTTITTTMSQVADVTTISVAPTNSDATIPPTENTSSTLATTLAATLWSENQTHSLQEAKLDEAPGQMVVVNNSVESNEITSPNQNKDT